jgi:hypothetical protein
MGMGLVYHGMPGRATYRKNTGVERGKSGDSTPGRGKIFGIEYASEGWGMLFFM